MAKILIVEDDSSMIRFLKNALLNEGYKVAVAENGITGISMFMSEYPDLILLDLGLPDIHGKEVLFQVKAQSDLPILIISEKNTQEEKVSLLDMGADDYITKPFHVNELLARIRVALRKKTSTPKENQISINGLTIFFERHKVFLEDEELHLTPSEFDLLAVLMKNAGKVLTHQYICEVLWKQVAEEDRSILRVFMANLRKKIEKGTKKHQYIRTEIGVGYRFLQE